MSLDQLKSVDPEVQTICAAELDRQQRGIELIASENFTSRAVMEAQGSCLTNKYAEGYPGRRYYGGCQEVDKVEALAIERAKALFGADHANVQPHSGSQANMAAYLALCPAGSKIMGMDLSHGGHLTHGFKLNFSGKLFECGSYGVEQESEQMDYDKIRDAAKKFNPDILICGASAYPRIIDFAKFEEIAKEFGAFLVADMAHIAGLVAAGLHPNPVPHCDIVTTTTHKTLRGPRSGLILCKEEHKKAVDSAVFPGMQGGPLMHVIAGKAVAFKEAASDSFKAYGKSIIENAAVMVEEFVSRGYRVVSGGTDNHLMLLDVTPKGVNGKQAEDALGKVEITVNKNQIPFDTLPPMKSSGIRIGTPAATSRGMDKDAMREVAVIIDEALCNHENEAELAKIKERTLELARKFPLYDGLTY